VVEIIQTTYEIYINVIPFHSIIIMPKTAAHNTQQQNRDAYRAQIREGLLEANRIVRGRARDPPCTFDPGKDDKLTEANSNKLAWDMVLLVRRMAGPERARSVALYGEEWWNKEMAEYNRILFKVFGGDLPEKDNNTEKIRAGVAAMTIDGGGGGGGGGAMDLDEYLHAVARARRLFT
jgi:hypothetical protein